MSGGIKFEPGYYWVRSKGYTRVYIAWFNGERWHHMGVSALSETHEIEVLSPVAPFQPDQSGSSLATIVACLVDTLKYTLERDDPDTARQMLRRARVRMERFIKAGAAHAQQRTENRDADDIRSPIMNTADLNAAIANLPGETVTKDAMEARIVDTTFVRLGATVTLCSLTLDNGYSVRGESACVDPANYNQEIGEKLARDQAFSKLWPLFGFLLAEARFRRAQAVIVEA